MLRLVLTPILVLTLAAGPWLCCCTAAQLAALGTEPDQAAPPASAPCCSEAHLTCDEEQVSESERSHNRSCPCQEGRPTGLVLVGVRADAAKSDTNPTFFDSLYNTILGSVSFLVASSVHPVLLDYQAHPKVDMLARLHILRC